MVGVVKPVLSPGTKPKLHLYSKGDHHQKWVKKLVRKITFVYKAVFQK